MLHLVNKKLLATSLMLLLIGCNSDMKFSRLENNVYEESISVVGKKTYNGIYKSMKDSLSYWKEFNKNSLALKIYPYQLDDLICINEKANMLISAVFIQCTLPSCTQENIRYFYGVKINEKWYFFFGPTLVIIRKSYQNNPHTPLSFATLHQIAMQEIFRGYLKKKDKGLLRNLFSKQEWEINDKFFDRLNKRDAYNFPYTTQKAWEESWMKLMKENWTYRDTTSYKNRDR